MQITIAVALCVTIEEDREPSNEAAFRFPPLSHLLTQLCREAIAPRHDSQTWRDTDGSQVA